MKAVMSSNLVSALKDSSARTQLRDGLRVHSFDAHTLLANSKRNEPRITIRTDEGSVNFLVRKR
jgi:hypothetical protein